MTEARPNDVVHVALNERSFGRGVAADRSDVDLLERFVRTLLALRRTVAVHNEHQIQVAVPDNVGALELPRGMTLSRARTRLETDFRDLLAQVLTSGPWFDSDGNLNGQRMPDLSIDNSAALGLAAAASVSNGIGWSLDVPNWRRLWVSGVGPGSNEVRVANAWQPEIESSHLDVIRACAPVLPGYENPGHHDPTNSQYDPTRAQIPRNARRLLRHAVPEAETTWWAFCEHRFFHRFSGSVVATGTQVHWNGTTNPRATRSTALHDVPSAIRRQLLGLEPAQDCGCRELDGVGGLDPVR